MADDEAKPKRGRKKKPPEEAAAVVAAPEPTATDNPVPASPEEEAPAAVESVESEEPVESAEPVSEPTATDNGPGWYRCIRECYGARTYRRGQLYELADNPSPTHFRKVGDA